MRRGYGKFEHAVTGGVEAGVDAEDDHDWRRSVWADITQM
jgi:hypothetical protein